MRLPLSPRHLCLPVLAVALAVACRDDTGPEYATTPADITVGIAELRTTVEALAHDSMCGRYVGTQYERQAAQYITSSLVRSGLEPKGTDGYLQAVTTGPVSRDPPPATAVCASEAFLGSQNVIGALPGIGALAGQWVIVGGHYDHVGWRVEGELTRVVNGADDNASGVAVVLELARLLSAWIAAHPDAVGDRRSIMFQAYGAEEIGLFGSRQYALSPTVPGDSLYAMVNLDMVGRLRDGTLLVIGANTSPAWPTIFAAAQPSDVQYVFSSEGVDRSDAWSFILHRGLPAVHVFTGLHDDYHTPADDPPLLNYRGITVVTEIALRVLWDLATRPDPL